MIYYYPRPQTIFKDTLFLIGETVDSGKFSEYNIPYKNKEGIKILNIKHDFLKSAIGRGIVKLHTKPGVFNDKPFYRIPVEIQLTLF